MVPSLLSRLVLVATSAASVAGWAGYRIALPPAGVPVGLSLARVEAAGAVATPAPSMAVRDRAAWQPSPVPARETRRAVEPARALPVLGAAPPAPDAATEAEAALEAEAAPEAASEVEAEVAPAPGRQIMAVAPELVASSMAAGAGGYAPRARTLNHDRLAALFESGEPAERGRWETDTFFSPALGQEVCALVWLPPGYDASAETYPALYLLHGAGGNGAFGKEEYVIYEVAEDIDRLLALGLVQPMILVLPDGEQGYWINQAGGGPRWADFVAGDLVAHVDATYRTDPARERRAVGGHSMGGHGALQLALNHPDTFAVAGAHSPSIRPFQQSPYFFGDWSWFLRYDPITLARSSGAAAQLTLWVDVGSLDPWRADVNRLLSALAAGHAAADFHVLEGGHESAYWVSYLPEYLRFYSNALAR